MGKAVFVCQVCGYTSPGWMGRCPDCGNWNTLVEERYDKSSRKTSRTVNPPQSLATIEVEEKERTRTDIGEFDRVLGGGIVPGSIVLIGGDPGIGKSTMLLQISERISKKSPPVLYISGEESPLQIKMRARRLGISTRDIYILAETCLEGILEHLDSTAYSVVIVDSIQTIYTETISSAPGSVSQVRETASHLMNYAKQSNIPVFLVGHVTKDGAIAGPRVLEHIVDTVLYFEGLAGQPFRILRAVKNRFGSTQEIGVFEMGDRGLREVKNPSMLFLSERITNAAGSVVVASIEGTRPILTEIQALVTPSPFGIPKRSTVGIDYNRLSLLIGVLEKRVGLHIQGQDIFINVVGGIQLDEPAVDLGIIISLASSFKEVPIDSSTVVFGEVGLGGEVRGVSAGELRIKEASKLGFKRCIIPERNTSELSKNYDIEIQGVTTVREAFEILFK